MTSLPTTLGIRSGQTGGKAAVFQNGIAVFAALLHESALPRPDGYAVIATGIRVFGVQVRPALRPYRMT